MTATEPSGQGATAPDISAPSGDHQPPPGPEPSQSAASPAAAAAPAPAVRSSATSAERPKAGAASSGSAAAQPAAKTKPPAADSAPQSKPEVSAGVTPPASAQPATAALQPAAAPALDLTALKQRLRDTNAIGVFTKLALKNQVDDLLDKFRDYYRGQVKITLQQLRQSYDLLVMKVLALLQDSDPALAREIVSSREAIWGLLADPQKFATL